MTQPAANLDQVIDGLSSILNLEKMMGSQGVELEYETITALHAAKQKASPARTAQRPAQKITQESAPSTHTGRLDSADKSARLAEIAEHIHASDVCDLKKSATQAVPGHGNPNADLVIIGEAPGREEDEQGLPFVGESGAVLDRLLNKAGIAREDVWIGNIVKWRPPNNRTPTLDEIQACLPFLQDQLTVIEPKVIFCLGGVAAKALLNTTSGITRLRGSWREFNGTPLMATYHPAFLERCEGAKKKKAYIEVWSDMVAVLEKLGLPVPE